MERGRTVWIAVKLMRPWKDLETERVGLVITVKTCVTNYHGRPTNEHRLPDHAPYSITGERDEERASRREEREEPGSFSPSMTFRLMRPRRGGYFLILTGWCPLALRGPFFLSSTTSDTGVDEGENLREKKSQIKPSLCLWKRKYTQTCDIKSRNAFWGHHRWKPLKNEQEWTRDKSSRQRRLKQ